MLELFMQGGQWSWLLLVVAVIIATLVVQNARRLRRAHPDDAARVRHGIHAIFFWGGVAVALGFLGQASGLYEGLSQVVDATAISSSRVAAGIAASCSSSILGMVVFLAAALLGIAMLGWHRRAFAGGGMR